MWKYPYLSGDGVCETVSETVCETVSERSAPCSLSGACGDENHVTVCMMYILPDHLPVVM